MILLHQAANWEKYWLIQLQVLTSGFNIMLHGILVYWHETCWHLQPSSGTMIKMDGEGWLVALGWNQPSCTRQNLCVRWQRGGQPMCPSLTGPSGFLHLFSLCCFEDKWVCGSKNQLEHLGSCAGESDGSGACFKVQRWLCKRWRNARQTHVEQLGQNKCWCFSLSLDRLFNLFAGPHCGV